MESESDTFRGFSSEDQQVYEEDMEKDDKKWPIKWWKIAILVVLIFIYI